MLHAVMVLFGAYLIINLIIAIIFISFNKHYNGESCSEASKPDTDGQTNVEIECATSSSNGHHKGQLAEVGDPSLVRLGWERLRDYCYVVQDSKWFEWTTTTMIVLNAIALALVWYNMPEQLSQATTYLNYFFTMYFLAEMLVKLVGLGPRLYLEDKMNWFDGLVSIVGVIEFIISMTPNVDALGGAMSVFRAFRLLRIFRLARSWKGCVGVLLWQTLLMSAPLYMWASELQPLYQLTSIPDCIHSVFEEGGNDDNSYPDDTPPLPPPPAAYGVSSRSCFLHCRACHG